MRLLRVRSGTVYAVCRDRLYLVTWVQAYVTVLKMIPFIRAGFKRNLLAGGIYLFMTHSSPATRSTTGRWEYPQQLGALYVL